MMRKRGDAVILIGDFNWHNQSWLGSNKTTNAGVHAEGVFASHGLEQLVDLPTRGENTLDLILTDIHTSRVKVSDREPIGKSDHCVLIADVALSLAREARTTRTVWNYAKADWGRLRKHFRDKNWNVILETGAASDDLLRAFEAEVHSAMKKFIPPDEKPSGRRRLIHVGGPRIERRL